MNKLAVFVIVGLFAVCIIMAFRPAPPPPVKYQHMFIIALHENLDEVYISIDGKEYTDQKRGLKKESQGVWDMNPIINLIHQYENQGWELQSLAGSGMHREYWLRKAIN